MVEWYEILMVFGLFVLACFCELQELKDASKRQDILDEIEVEKTKFLKREADT